MRRRSLCKQHRTTREHGGGAQETHADNDTCSCSPRCIARRQSFLRNLSTENAKPLPGPSTKTATSFWTHSPLSEDTWGVILLNHIHVELWHLAFAWWSPPTKISPVLETERNHQPFTATSRSCVDSDAPPHNISQVQHLETHRHPVRRGRCMDLSDTSGNTGNPSMCVRMMQNIVENHTNSKTDV